MNDLESLSQLMSGLGLISNKQFSEAVNQQHYSFAHKMMPYIVKNHFHDLVSKVIDKSAQDWILRLWDDSSEIPSSTYTTLVHPKCHFIPPSDDIGVILISMPAPRVCTEAIYTAVVFAVEKHRSPFEWLRYYFTLELGLSTSAHWVLGAWDDSGHKNFGEFKYEPTVENFLAVVVAEGPKKWK
jgi:hypothetical protein